MLAAACFVLLIHHLLAEAPRTPKNDSLRYIDYAVNLTDHGVFGLSGGASAPMPVPGNANTPLYPLFVAGMMAIDEELANSFRCLIRNQDAQRACPSHYETIAIAQYPLVVISMLVMWLLVRHLFAAAALAWLAALWVPLSTGYLYYAHWVVTENLVFPLFLAMQLFLLLFLKNHRSLWACGIALSLGLLTLTRPEYLYLALAFLVVAGGFAATGKHPGLLRGLLLGGVLYLALVGSWAMRNQAQFGSPLLTAGNYGEIVLSHRLSYNRMTTREWLGAFIYWLPDFGDKLAPALLPAAWYAKLPDQAEGSYNRTAEEDILVPARRQVREESELLGYLLKTQVLGQPVRHVLVSLPFAWRGLFVGDYWGMLGLCAYLALLLHLGRRGNWVLLHISLPTLLLVALYAATSLSLPRYNLSLISLYAVGWAWYSYRLLRRFAFPNLPSPHAP